jgi:CoA:oxalate CoA-transferase
VRTIVDAIADPQVMVREMLVSLNGTEHDPVINLGTPVKLSRTPAALVSAPPRLGEHTDEVLRALEASTPRIVAG